MLAWRACRALPDRGYCAAKTLGALLVGLVAWWGYALGLLRNTAGGVALAVFVLAAVAALLLGPARAAAAAEIAQWVRRRWRLIVAVELLQVVAFLGWCLVRANDPAADHTEEPMDLMLLVAVSTSDSFPPADPWLSGYPISYYYLGYWLLGTIGHLVGTPPEITYNLGQATWYALLVVGCFGLAYNLAAASRPGRRRRTAPPARSTRDSPSDRTAIGSGLIAALLVCGSANIALPLDWGRRVLDGAGSSWSEAIGSWKALLGQSAGTTANATASAASALWSENWWWWRSSRVVRDVGLDGQSIEVITEFPFFSYLLGDNHPHVLAMPIVVASLTLAFAVFANAWSGERAASRSAAGAGVPGGLATRVGIVAVAGSIVAINTWDVPAVFSVLVIAVTAAAAPSHSSTWRRALVAAASFAALLAVGAAVLYLPYHLTASSQVEGILPNFFHPTSLRQVVVMFATLAPGVFLLVLTGWRRGEASVRLAAAWWIALLGLALAWFAACLALAQLGVWREWLDGMLQPPSRDRLASVVLGRWAGGCVTLVLCAGALAFTLEALRARWVSTEARRETGLAFALLLAAAGLGLVLAPELLYLHDSFGTRMNTVFKFWYQAWLLLACGAAVGITSALRLAHPRLGRGARARPASRRCSPCSRSCRVSTTRRPRCGRAPEDSAPSSRRSTRWRGSSASVPSELAALRWLRASTNSDDVVVQRSGASYRAEQNLPSIVTGRATLLGWGGHEYQWRGSSFSSFAAGREEAIERIYRPTSTQELDSTLRSWSVDYIYVGPEETDPLRRDRGRRERDRRRVRPGVRERAGAHLPAAGVTVRRFGHAGDGRRRVVLAAVVRFAGLGSDPLDAAEASQSIAAWWTVEPQSEALSRLAPRPESGLLLGLDAALFWLTDTASDLAARLDPGARGHRAGRARARSAAIGAARGGSAGGDPARGRSLAGRGVATRQRCDPRRRRGRRLPSALAPARDGGADRRARAPSRAASGCWWAASAGLLLVSGSTAWDFLPPIVVGALMAGRGTRLLGSPRPGAGAMLAAAAVTALAGTTSGLLQWRGPALLSSSLESWLSSWTGAFGEMSLASIARASAGVLLYQVALAALAAWGLWRAWNRGERRSTEGPSREDALALLPWLGWGAAMQLRSSAGPDVWLALEVPMLLAAALGLETLLTQLERGVRAPRDGSRSAPSVRWRSPPRSPEPAACRVRRRRFPPRVASPATFSCCSSARSPSARASTWSPVRASTACSPGTCARCRRGGSPRRASRSTAPRACWW